MSGSNFSPKWWALRLSAVALIPLSLWFVVSMICLLNATHAEVLAWLASPCNAIAMLLFLPALFYHSQLGLEEVIEDYIAADGTRVVVTTAVKFANIALCVAGMFFVLKISLGA